MRRFYDAAGRAWLVYDVTSDSLAFGNRSVLPAAFRDGWLVFECDGDRRRLAPVPAEWPGFPESALRAMLDRAEPAPPRPPAHRREREIGTEPQQLS